jgi:acetolactate synthase-1/2/3 large subunit
MERGKDRRIHIDTVPADIDNDYRPTVELVGDLATTLVDLLLAVDAAGLPLERDAETARIVDRERTRLAENTDLGDPDHDDAFGLDPVAVVAGIRAALPDAPPCSATSVRTTCTWRATSAPTVPAR